MRLRHLSWAFSLLSLSAFAAIENSKKPEVPKSISPNDVATPKWMLQDFLKISSGNPTQLIRIAEKMYAPDRLRITAVEVQYAHDWQHRLAMVQALSDVFDTQAKRTQAANAENRASARKLIVATMLNDPSLLVRDGAVESVRRIMKMRPQERFVWKKPLEEAFLSKRNFEQGEGFFIRETILTTLREGAMELSNPVRRAAKADKNERVQDLLKLWNTQAFDTL